MEIKQRIIEEAASMFRKYGIRAVTMDMLAGQMGISKRTIYEVFSDKDELLQGVLRWMTLKQLKLTTDILNSSENVIEAIFRILEIMLEHYRKMSPAFRLDMKKFHNDLVNRMKEREELPYNNSRDILIRGIEEGVFRSDIDIELTNRCLTGVTRMSNEKDVFPDENSDEEVIRDFFINYLRGISTPKGLELINAYNRNKPTGNSNNNRY